MLLAVILKITEHSLYKEHGPRVSLNLITVPLPMRESHLGLVILSRVHLRRRELVAHAFYRVFVRHKRRDLAVVVEPVFYMMLISALVVEPRAADAVLLTAYADGRAVARVVFRTLNELLGREFRQIVHYSAPYDTASRAMTEHRVLVPYHKRYMTKEALNSHTNTS